MYKHCINRGFGSGLPSGQDLLTVPICVWVADGADGVIKCEEAVWVAQW
jgi:hypothetical protein